MHFVSQFESIFAQSHAATKTLGDIEPLGAEFTGELEAHTAQSALEVDANAGHKLTDDSTKVAGLESARRGTVLLYE